MIINYETLYQIYNQGVNQYDYTARKDREAIDYYSDVIEAMASQYGNETGPAHVTYIGGNTTAIIPQYVCEGATEPNAFHVVQLTRLGNVYSVYEA